MTRRQKILGVISTFLLSLSTGEAAWAATYYVATNGNDSNAGTQAAPFKTIAHAVKKMNAGDTTYVRGGVYNEAGVFFGRSGTASAPIKLLNAPGESPVINCMPSTSAVRRIVIIQNASGYTNPIGHITIEGFEIRNCWHGINITNAHDIVIRRNWIHDSRFQGILGNGTKILVDRNVITHNGDFAACSSGGKNKFGTNACVLDHGIYGSGTNWIITNNLIYDNLSYGIQAAGYKKDYYAGPEYGGASGWLIANNTIAYQNYRSAIGFWQGRTTNNKVINNIFYENSQKYSGTANGVSFTNGNSGGGHTISSNICYSTNSRTCIGADGVGKYTGSNNVNANPNFEGAGPTLSGVPNFKLRAGSPAIDKGQSLSQVTWDHAGGGRPVGANFDIGAYEDGAAPNSGSPPPNPTGGGESGASIGGCSTAPASSPTTPINVPAGPGKTYYVATNGSDSASGSESSPWKTIKYAVSRMNAGDTTYVRGGVYNEGSIHFGRSGTQSSPIKLLAAPGESPVIDFGNTTNSVGIQNSTGIRNPLGYITIEGFEIRNGHFGIVMYNGFNITISRNWIHHAASQGIHGNGRKIMVDRNVISRNGNFAKCAEKKSACNQMHGIYSTGPNWVITNNLIYDNLAYGIQVAGYAYCPDGSCYSGGAGGTTAATGGSFKAKPYTSADYAGADNWLIANNTIAYNNYRAGIGLWQGKTTNAKIINNILYENSQKYPGDPNGVSFWGSGGGHVIQNNISYATSPGSTGWVGPGTQGQGKYTESGNIVNTVNPNFEGAGATISGVPNFKLKTGSPAIDKGQSLSQVTWDHAGGKRPVGVASDIGAYEFNSPADSGSPPPNPTGGAGIGGSSGDCGPFGFGPLLGPTGEVCPAAFLP